MTGDDVSDQVDGWAQFWRDVDAREQQIKDAVALAERAESERIALLAADYAHPEAGDEL